MRWNVRLALGLSLCALSLAAADARVGVEVIARQYGGDAQLTSQFGRNAFGVGLLGQVELSPLSAVRVRTQYGRTQEHSTHGMWADASSSTTLDERRYLETFFVGADYLCHLDGLHQGLFAYAGVGLNRTSIWRDLRLTVTDASGTTVSSGPTEGSTTKPRYEIGVGQRFTRAMGVELRHGFSSGWNGRSYGSTDLVLFYQF